MLIMCSPVPNPLPNQEPELDPELAAVLLAGGKSRRMGTDKALLPIGGQPLLQRAADRLRSITNQVLLSTSDSHAYDFLGLPVVADLFPGCGPMAGLHAALLHTRRPRVLVLACDIPDVPARLLRLLSDQAAGSDAAVPSTSDGTLHPVCAVYGRTCLPFVETYLRCGKHRMLNLVENPNLRIRVVTPGSGDFCDADLVDLNSPEDYEAYLKRL